MKKIGVFLLLWVSTWCLQAQTITQFEYFIDTDPGVKNATLVNVPSPSATISGFSIAVNVASISNGFHILGIRAKDNVGVWGHTQISPLYKEIFTSPVGTTLTRYEWFIDTDPGVGLASGGSIPSNPVSVLGLVIPVNVATISSGFHTIGIRLKSSEGKWGHTGTSALYKEIFTSTTNTVITQLEWFIDTDPGHGLANTFAIASPSSIIGANITANITTVSVGTHQFVVRAKDNTGKWSIVANQSFTKNPPSSLTILGLNNSFSSFAGSISQARTITVSASNLLSPTVTLTGGGQLQFSDFCCSAFTNSKTISISTGTGTGNVVLYARLRPTVSGINVLTVTAVTSVNGIYSQTTNTNVETVTGGITTISNTTITSCGTMVISPNHPNTYLNNQNLTMVILPTAPGLKLTAQVANSFVSEWDGVSNPAQDELDVYEDAGTGGLYWQNYGWVTYDPVVITSSGVSGAVTLKWVTNSTNTFEGFAVKIGCVGTATGTKLNQTISLSPISNITLSGANQNINISGSASSGLSVSYGIQTQPAGIASLSGNVITVNNTGTVTVTANQIGNGTYNPALAVSVSFNVSTITSIVKQNQTISISPISNITLSGANQNINISGSASSGLSVSYSIQTQPAGIASLSGNVITVNNTGNVTITANQIGDGTYNPALAVSVSFNVSTITSIVKQNQTISISPISNITLSGANQNINISGSASSGLSVSYSIQTQPLGIASLSGNVITVNNTGTVTVTANQIGNGTYNPALAVSVSFNVSTITSIVKQNQTISISPISNITLSGANQNINISGSASSGLSVSYSIQTQPLGIASLSGNVITVNNTGTVTITANQIGNGTYNPALAVSVSFNVSTITSIVKQNQTISISPISNITLSGANQNINISGSASSGLSVSYIIQTQPLGIASLSGNMITVNNTGTVTITGSQAGNTIYNAAADVSVVFDVNNSNLTGIFNKSLLQITNFNIYPNPSTGTFTIESQLPIKEQIVIYNTLGVAIQTISSKGENTIKVSGLTTGMYLVQIGSFKQKVMVE